MSEEVIDGDRFIAFIDAIKNLGEIAEGMNVIGVKDAFLVGKQVGSVQAIIDQEKKWKACLTNIADALESEGKLISLHKAELSTVITYLKQATSVLHNPELVIAKERLKEFVTLLDRLEHHNQTGTLKLFAALCQT